MISVSASYDTLPPSNYPSAGLELLDISAPSGQLPVSFPAEINHPPRPYNTDPERSKVLQFNNMRQDISIDYGIEGADVGYNWFERTGQEPLFPFTDPVSGPPSPSGKAAWQLFRSCGLSNPVRLSLSSYADRLTV